MSPRPRLDRKRTQRRSKLGLCLLLAALATLPTSAQAAPPDNDNFADARIVSVGDRVTGTTVEATQQAGEPASGASYTRSVWYRLTPSLFPGPTQPVRIDTCSGGSFSELAVYTGTGLGDLTAVPHTRNGCTGGSRLYLDVAAQTTYYVRVSGSATAPGPIVLQLAHPLAPANDNFENAQAIAGPAQIRGTNVDATVQPGEPAPAVFGGSGRSVWYRLTATTNDSVVASTCVDANDPILAVYTGTRLGSLTEVGTEGGACGTRTSMFFPTTAGTTYYIAVRSRGDGAEEFTLNISGPIPPPPLPDIPVPPAPPCSLDPGLITYTGTHAAGGAVCLRVRQDGTGVAWFSATSIPGDRCTIPWFSEVMHSLPAPIDDRRFSFGSPSTRLVGAFPTNRSARGTLQVTQRSVQGACHSAPIAWTATTTGTPPWADFTAPSLRLGGATVQRPLRGGGALVVRVGCREEACAASASATVAGVRVTAARRTVRPSGSGRPVRLALSLRARRALTSALRRRPSIRARVTVVARDREGNRATARRTITLRR